METAVAATLFALLFIAVWQAFDATATETANGLASTSLDAALRKCLTRMTEEIADSGTAFDGTEYVTSHPRTATTSQSTITFQTRVGLTGAATDWSDPITYSLTPSGSEDSANGVDDDGDGIVDEQTLTRTVATDTGNEVSTIAEGVTALIVQRDQNSDVIRINVTAARATSMGTLSRTLTTSITVKNRN